MKTRWKVEIEGAGACDFDSKEAAEGYAEEVQEMYPHLIVEVTETRGEPIGDIVR